MLRVITSGRMPRGNPERMSAASPSSDGHFGNVRE
jgi:hypothetical protein